MANFMEAVHLVDSKTPLLGKKLLSHVPSKTVLILLNLQG